MNASNTIPQVKATIPTPTLRFAAGSTVVPGDRLGSIRQILPGKGTYVRSGYVFASLVGKLAVVEAIDNSGNDESGHSHLSEATPGSSTTSTPPRASYSAVALSSKEIASERVLRVGDVVLGRILRINNQQAFVEILAKQSADCLLTFPCEGYIRGEDVRTMATEEAQIQDSFLPGDVVLARVLSLGDARRYLLTTGSPELGVIHAVSSVSGRPMVPSSWKEMRCPVSGHVEPRKVAKPRDLSAEH